MECIKCNNILSVICIAYKLSSYYTEIHVEFNKTNRVWIAHTELEIRAIIETRVFCVDKICFPRPGHICS